MAKFITHHALIRTLFVVLVSLIIPGYPAAQCTINIVDPTLPSLDISAGETACINAHVEVTGSVNVAEGGTLMISSGQVLMAGDLTSMGNIELLDHSLLYVQSFANLEGNLSVTTIGESATFFMCNEFNVGNGAQLFMNTLSTVDCFDGNFILASGVYPYFEYIGIAGSDPLAQIIVRNQMMFDGMLSNSDMVGYCPVQPAAALTPVQLGNAVNYCSPLFPPSMINSNNCDSIVDYYEVIILPIVFTYIDVQSGNGIYRVEWSISDAENISHFIVERSCNDTAYCEAGQLRALPGSKDYLFADHDAPTYNNVQYRVKAVTRSGVAYVSRVRRAGTAGLLTLKAWPNPIRGVFNISIPFQPRLNTAIIQIMNATGKLVYQREHVISGPVIQMPLQVYTALMPGLYFARVRIDGRSFMVKLVKR